MQCIKVRFEVTLGLGSQSLQNGKMTYMRKNGSQQTMKVVTTTTMVLAALRSLAICCLAFSLMNLWMASLSCGLALTIGGDEDEMASRFAVDVA